MTRVTGCKVTAETSRDKSRHVTLPRPSAPSSGVPGRHELPPEVALQTQEGRQEPPRQVLVSSISASVPLFLYGFSKQGRPLVLFKFKY